MTTAKPSPIDRLEPSRCKRTIVCAVAVAALATVGCSGGDPTSAAIGSGGAKVSATAGGSASNGGTSATGGSQVLGGAATAAGARPASGSASSGGGSRSSGGAQSTTSGGVPSTTTGTSTGGLAEGGTAASVGGSAQAGAASTAGGSGSPAGNAGASGSTGPTRVCDEPAPWALPTTSRVVGSGTASSCTASALSAAVVAGGSIEFDCGSAPITIALTKAIQVTKATVVDGGGLVTLDGGGASQIFVVASNNTLSVRNLRFVNGKAPDDAEAAGIGGAVSGNWRSKVEVIGCVFEDNRAARGGGAVAVWTGSSLTIVGSRFLRNQSWYGGAVYSLLSPLSVINSEFTDNSTVLRAGFGDGGAIGTDGASESPSDTVGGTIQICGTQIRNSQGNGSGGGAYLWMYPPDRAIIDRTSLTANAVVKNAANQGAIGGAMRISNGAIVIKDSSFLSNTSIGNGGGLYLDCAPACTITNSTFHANKSAGWGGAIFSGTSSGTIGMNNVTVAGNNQQNTQGNAIFGSATWTFNNCIFLDNGCASTGSGSNVLQWVTSSKSAGSGPCISGVIAKDPMLGAPNDNGGSTPTMLPGAASGALQVGANCESTDQRGHTRNVDACDVGAVEVP